MTFRTAVRALARTPGFSIIVVLTLAIGIGATTAMFSIVNGVLFRPLRFPAADRLYLARTAVSSAETGRRGIFPVNARQFVEWRSRCQSCEGVALLGANGVTLTGLGSPERLPGLEVSFNFFRTLGIAPRLGRDFSKDEEGPSGYHVILLSDGFWLSHFGADPSVVGRSITLNGETHTIVGVMPEMLTLPRGTEWGPFFPMTRAPVVFRPFSLNFSAGRPMGSFNYVAVVRTRPGLDGKQAESEMTASTAAFGAEDRVEMQALLTPMAQQVTGSARRTLLLLAGAVVALLALVSLNIGGLLLVRSIGRAREASIRLALGAGRRDLIRPMLAEVSVLVALGGVLGALLAQGALRVFIAAAPVGLPRVEELRADWWILALAFGASAFAAALASIAPIVRLTRLELQQPLTAAARGATDSRGRLRTLDAMMIVEVALSTAVLMVGALLATSLLKVMQADRGFTTEQVVTQPLPLTSPKYQGVNGERSRLVDSALQAFAALPGVSAVGVTSQLPLRGETWVDTLVDADHPGDERQAPLVNRRFISPDLIAAMGVPVIEGRGFEDTDRRRLVALVSERSARLLWPNGSAIGKHIWRADPTRGPSDPQEKAEIVGVVGDVKTTGLEQEPAPTVYEPHWQLAVGLGGPVFVFRTSRDVSSLAGDIRSVVAVLDDELPVAPPQTMGAIVSEVSAVRRFQTVTVAAFAAVALAIAALGLYGLVAFRVTRRTREIGLRAALGATRSRILTMMLAQGLRPVAIGGAIGMVAAFIAGDLLASQLYGVTARDPLVLAVVASTLAVVAVGACWIPAQRATRVDPMIPLRAE